MRLRETHIQVGKARLATWLGDKRKTRGYIVITVNAMFRAAARMRVNVKRPLFTSVNSEFLLYIINSMPTSTSIDHMSVWKINETVDQANYAERLCRGRKEEEEEENRKTERI